MKPIIKYNEQNLYLDVNNYNSNGQLSISLVKKDGGLFDYITINLPNGDIDDNQVFINNNLSNDIKQKLYDTNVFLNSHDKIKYNMGIYDIAYVNENILKDYIKDTYYINIWQNDYHREQGICTKDDKMFDSMDEAIKYARAIFDEYDLSSIEIVDYENKVYFCKDDESEEFYINNDKISKYTKEIVDEYINSWINHQELQIKEKKIYCETQDGIYVAADNSTNDCWVEDFKNEKDAQNWLLGKDLEEDLINEI